MDGDEKDTMKLLQLADGIEKELQERIDMAAADRDRAIKIGLMLKEAQQIVPSPEWDAWVSRHVRFSMAEARAYMIFARAFIELTAKIAARLAALAPNQRLEYLEANNRTLCQEEEPVQQWAASDQAGAEAIVASCFARLDKDKISPTEILEVWYLAYAGRMRCALALLSASRPVGLTIHMPESWLPTSDELSKDAGQQTPGTGSDWQADLAHLRAWWGRNISAVDPGDRWRKREPTAGVQRAVSRINRRARHH